MFREEGPDSPTDREPSKPVWKIFKVSIGTLKKTKTFQKMDSLFSFKLLNTKEVSESCIYYLIPVRNTGKCSPGIVPFIYCSCNFNFSIKNFIYLRCTTWWLDIYSEMIMTVKLVNIIFSYSYSVCVCDESIWNLLSANL